MKWETLCAALLVVAAISPILPSQRPAKYLGQNEIGASGESDFTAVGVLENGRLLLSTATEIYDEVQTGVASPGGAVLFGPVSALVVGRDGNGDGILEHWKAENGQLALSSWKTIPGSDYCGVVYDDTADLLYLLNCVSHEIQTGSWNGAGDLASVQLSSWATATEVPDLLYAERRMLWNNGGGQLRLVAWPILRFEKGWLIWKDNSNILASPYSQLESLAIDYPDVLADQTSATEEGNSVFVFSEPFAAFEIVDVQTGQVLGVGGSGGGVGGTATLSAPLEIGLQYIARVAGGGTPHVDNAFECVRRYGHPESFSNGAEMRRMYLQRRAYVGNSEFNVGVGVVMDPPPQEDISLSGIMLVSVRVGGVDAVVPSGNNMLLQTSAYVPAKGYISAHSGQGSFFAKYPIPDDPNVAGLVYLVQFVAKDGPDYRLSEVYGGVIHEVAVAQAAGAGGNPPTTSVSSPSILQAFAVQHWWADLQTNGLLSQSANLWRRVLTTRR